MPVVVELGDNLGRPSGSEFERIQGVMVSVKPSSPGHLWQLADNNNLTICYCPIDIMRSFFS